MSDFKPLLGEEKPRISQRDVAPEAMKGRNISNFIYVSEDEPGAVVTTLSNGDEVYVRIELNHSDDVPLLALPYITLYVGSVADANELPGGSGIDESQWQVIGPKHPYDTWAERDFPRNEESVVLYIRNISAGASKTVLISSRWKYLSLREIHT